MDEENAKTVREAISTETISKKSVSNFHTWVNNVLTLCMVIVTIFLVYWAAKQWDAATQQAVAAKKQAEAAMKQIEVAEKQIEIMRRMNDDTISLSREAIKYAKEQSAAAKESLNDQRALSKIAINPEVKLRTALTKAGDILPHFTIENIGLVDIEQIKTQLFSHRFMPEKGGIGVSSYGSEGLYVLPSLPKGKSANMKFPDYWLDVNTRIQKPLHHNIMEIRLIYRRPADLKLYEASAFYFINPDGDWVSEDSQSIRSEVYRPIKDAAHRSYEMLYMYPPDSDKLYQHTK